MRVIWLGVVTVLVGNGAVRVIALGVETLIRGDSSLDRVVIPFPIACKLIWYLFPGKNGLVIAAPET